MRRGSLYALLHSPSLQLSWAQVAFMVLGAASGMRHLHAHAVLHRDLKSGAFPPHPPPCLSCCPNGWSRSGWYGCASAILLVFE